MDGASVPSPGGKPMARNATPEILISNLEDATAIDFLYEDEMIFWTAVNLVVSLFSQFSYAFQNCQTQTMTPFFTDIAKVFSVADSENVAKKRNEI